MKLNNIEIAKCLTKFLIQPSSAAAAADIKQEIAIENCIIESQYSDINIKIEEDSAADIKEEISIENNEIGYFKFEEDSSDSNKFPIPIVQYSLTDIEKETDIGHGSLDEDDGDSVNEARYSNTIKLETKSADSDKLPLQHDLKEEKNIIEATAVDPAIGNLLSEADYSYIDVQIEEDSSNVFEFSIPEADVELEENTIYYIVSLIPNTIGNSLDKPDYSNIGVHFTEGSADLNKLQTGLTLEDAHKRTYYKYCVVPMCSHTSINTPNKIFIRVPIDPTRRLKWLKACRKNVKEISFKNTAVHVCEDHFNLEEDMVNYMKFKLMGGMKKMKPHVLPHIFKCQPPESRKRSVIESSKILKIKRAKRKKFIDEQILVQ